MAKGRPSPERQEMMYAAFKNAYEKLIEQDKSSFPTWIAITNHANKDKSIKNSPEGKIGDKTIEQSKNPKIVALRQRIKDDKELFEQIADQMPSELSVRNKELKSSIEANVLLVQELEQKEKTIENKNNHIDELNTRIADYEIEIRRLRSQISEMTRESSGH